MDFSTTILLSPEENNRYQAIYASQRYGTFYGLFGKFDIEKKGKKTFLRGIDLKLINYIVIFFTFRGYNLDNALRAGLSASSTAGTFFLVPDKLVTPNPA